MSAGKFARKVAIVTGSSSGIGQAVVLLLAQQGANVTVHGLTEEECEETHHLLLEQNISSDRILIVPGNLIDPKVAERLVNETLTKWGQIDVVINNAGCAGKGGVPMDSEENFSFLFDINMKSIIRINNLAIPFLEKTKGAIVNTCSIAAIRNVSVIYIPTYYAMTKAALENYMKYEAPKLAKRGIRMNNIAPGIVATNIYRMPLDECQRKTNESCRRHVPLGRTGTTVEIANAVSFLASEEASYVCGTTLVVDGGLMVQLIMSSGTSMLLTSNVLTLADKKGIVRTEALRQKQNERLANPHYFKLVQESSAVFKILLDEIEDVKHNGNDSQALMGVLDKSSRLYRATLRGAILGVSRSESEEDRKLLLSLRGREIMWGLVELVMFYDEKKEIGGGISRWARMMLTGAAADIAAQVVTDSSRPGVPVQRTPLYWNAVIVHILAFNFDSALTLLNAQKGAQYNREVGKMVIILERIHRLFKGEYRGSEFMKIQKHIYELLNQKFFTGNHNIEFIARLLIGSKEEFKNVCERLVDYWCEAVPFYMVTQMPTGTLNQLVINVEECMEIAKKEGDARQELDLTIRSVVGRDVADAMLRAGQCFGDWWFSAHLGDLIFRIEPVVFYEQFCNANLRDVFVLEYAHSLFEEGRLWKDSLKYIRDVDGGYEFADEYVVALPLDSMTKANEVIDICEEWQLTTLKTVRGNIAMRCLEESMLDYPAAVSWALKSENLEIITKVSNEVLRHAKTEDLSAINRQTSIRDVDKYTTPCPELYFLVLYCKYMSNYEAEMYTAALDDIAFIFDQCPYKPVFMYQPLLQGIISCAEHQGCNLNQNAKGLQHSMMKLETEIIRSVRRVGAEDANRTKDLIEKARKMLSGPLVETDLIDTPDSSSFRSTPTESDSLSNPSYLS
ncbi:hypothetical protein QR680_013666 [Steinernema hermaphroditum]|uniref:Nuclear pore complex protein Nup85 n=1 Tax=Steinernema hermaphroditum TaxID=289476 RepID=A0AA39I8C5_9BILA|nr:hypothetical protein QR680_013666 [Steinernema hermaphroditum]